MAVAPSLAAHHEALVFDLVRRGESFSLQYDQVSDERQAQRQTLCSCPGRQHDMPENHQVLFREALLPVHHRIHETTLLKEQERQDSRPL